MKIKALRFICAILMLAMTVSFVCSCANNEETDATDAISDTTETTSVETSAQTSAATTETSKDTESKDTEKDDEDKVVEILPIFADKKTKYTIVAPDDMSAEVAEATNELKCLIGTFGSTQINVKNVSSYQPLFDPDLDAPKIIIGSVTEYAHSIDLRYSLPTNEFAIQFVDNTLYITGKSNADTLRAWEYFKLTYLYKGMTELAFENGFYYESTSNVVEGITVNGVALSEYTIVYRSNSFHAKKRAEFIRSAIYRKTGLTLGLVTDASDEKTNEILVGKTNRAASDAVRASYDRPNIYYDAIASEGKLVIMGEGYKTLSHVSSLFETYLYSITEAQDISGSIVSGNVRDYVDTTAMMDRAEGTDLRVLHYNMAAPYLYNDHAIYKNDNERGEAIADMILAYYPDIITTDEIYNSKQTTHHINLYKAVMKELSEYYNIVDPSPYDDGKPFENSVGDFNYGINENILYKKELGLTLLGSGWRYGSTPVNGSHALYLGFHSAAFEMTNGTNFIVSAGHYGDSGSTDIWAQEHHQNVAALREKLGLDETVPTILTGDMYTVKGSAGYNYHVSQGFFDSQQSTLSNQNLTIRGDVIQRHGTFHTIGVRQSTRAAEDFVWYNAAFESLQFKVIASELTDRTSDHYPVISDLKLK